MPLEPFAPTAGQLRITHGLLEGVSSVPDGVGDLRVDGALAARLTWGQRDGESWCEVAPVPVGAIVGRVLDAAGQPVAGARVSGCQDVDTSGDDGGFELQAPDHKRCKVRAVVVGDGARVSEVVETAAPSEIELTVADDKPPEQIETELGSASAALKSAVQVQEQLASMFPGSQEDLDRSKERLQLVEEALSSDDPDVQLDAWLELE